MDQSCESDRELCRTLESLGSPGNFLLFLALSSDLDRGDLDLENGLEDLDRSFHIPHFLGVGRVSKNFIIIEGGLIFIYGNYFITVKLVFVQKQYI